MSGLHGSGGWRAHCSIHNMMPPVSHSMCLSVHSLELSMGHVTEHNNAALQEAGLGVIFTSFSVILNF